MNKQLFRSRRNRLIAGVCGGFAEYFNIDPTIVRIILVAIGLATAGTAVIIYVIAAIVMPQEQDGSCSTCSRTDNDNAGDGDFGQGADEWKQTYEWKQQARFDVEKNRTLIGIVLIFLGVLFLGKQLFHWFDIKYLLPLLLIVIGAFIIYKGRGNSV